MEEFAPYLATLPHLTPGTLGVSVILLKTPLFTDTEEHPMQVVRPLEPPQTATVRPTTLPRRVPCEFGPLGCNRRSTVHGKLIP